MLMTTWPDSDKYMSAWNVGSWGAVVASSDLREQISIRASFVGRRVNAASKIRIELRSARDQRELWRPSP
jgi:hypothetical protein